VVCSTAERDRMECSDKCQDIVSMSLQHSKCCDKCQDIVSMSLLCSIQETRNQKYKLQCRSHYLKHQSYSTNNIHSVGTNRHNKQWAEHCPAVQCHDSAVGWYTTDTVSLWPWLKPNLTPDWLHIHLETFWLIRNKLWNVGFEVFTNVCLQILVFWVGAQGSGGPKKM